MAILGKLRGPAALWESAVGLQANPTLMTTVVTPSPPMGREPDDDGEVRWTSLA
jgi:hypothetical protein